MFISLGSSPDLFIFKRSSMMPNKYNRKYTQKISRHKQHGKADILQYNGPGKESMSFTGEIMPGTGFGTSESLDLLRDLSDKGEQRLIMGGEDKGKWLITDISDGHDYLDTESNAKVISFSFNLEKQG